MASYNLAAGDKGVYEKALAAATVDTVNVQRKGVSRVRIITNGSASIFIRTDGTAPTVGAQAADYLPAVAGAYVDVPFPSDSATGSVKLISVGTPTYSVVAL
jgi:hypothetical protein